MLERFKTFQHINLKEIGKRMPDEIKEVDVSEVTQKPNEDEVELISKRESDTDLDEKESEPILSDGNCPLVVDHIFDFQRIVEDVDGTRIIRREPFIQMERPMACPTCGKVFEKHHFPVNQYGEPDCSVASSLKGNPRYASFFDALGSTNEAIRKEAEKHAYLGDRLLKVYAPNAYKEKMDERNAQPATEEKPKKSSPKSSR